MKPGTLVHISVPGTPFAKQRARGTKDGHHFTPTKTRTYEDHVAVCAQEAWAGFPPLAEPVRVDVFAWFPRPKSKIWKRKPMPADWYVGTKDKDNIDKIVFDGLVNAGVFVDDRWIVAGETVKLMVDGYGKQQPRVVVHVRHPGDPTDG